MISRPATVSPSATTSSVVTYRSGKAVRSILTICRVESGVRRDQVVYDGEVALVEDLFKGRAVKCLVLFF